MSTYKITTSLEANHILLTGEFGAPADNDIIVRDAANAVQEALVTALAPERPPRRLLFTGRASLPVAFVVAHAVAHLFREIGVFDPKLSQYVIVISHGGVPVGTLVNG
jgi:CRISPR-associated protein Csx3